MAAEHAEHDHTKRYVTIWGILLGLLVVSVVGPMLEIPIVTLITAFGVAVIKATLVMKYFMHLDHELKLVWYILSGAVILMVLYFFGVAPDVMNHEGSRWVNVSAKAAVERGLAAGDGHHGEGDHGDASHGDEAHGEGDHGAAEDAHDKKEEEHDGGH